MMQKSNLHLIIASAVIGLSLIICAVFISGKVYQIKTSGDIVSVTGSAQRIITSDTVKWISSFSRTVDVNGLQSGYEAMKSDLAKIKDYLFRNGVDEKQIAVSTITVITNYENFNTGKIIGYTLSQIITVTSHEVDKITVVAGNSGELINAGILFNSEPLQYYYSKLSDLKLEMIGEAMKNAESRAQVIAKNANAKVGKIKSVSQGVFQITPVNSADISDYGYYDTSSIQKEITAIVKASFSIR